MLARLNILLTNAVTTEFKPLVQSRPGDVRLHCNNQKTTTKAGIVMKKKCLKEYIDFIGTCL